MAGYIQKILHQFQMPKLAGSCEENWSFSNDYVPTKVQSHVSLTMLKKPAQWWHSVEVSKPECFDAPNENAAFIWYILLIEALNIVKLSSFVKVKDFRWSKQVCHESGKYLRPGQNIYSFWLTHQCICLLFLIKTTICYWTA